MSTFRADGLAPDVTHDALERVEPDGEGEPLEAAAEPMEQEEGEPMEEEGHEEEQEEDTRLEGTALYLSPELVRGGRPTVASDCWALGCTLYQALCGKPPLWADSDAEVSQGHA